MVDDAPLAAHELSVEATRASVDLAQAESRSIDRALDPAMEEAGRIRLNEAIAAARRRQPSG
jgi:hypothetical protein